MHNIIVWKKPNGEYYYRVYEYFYGKYYVGYKNGYDHEVILIIPGIYYYRVKPSIFRKIKKMLLTKLISFLEKLNR